MNGIIKAARLDFMLLKYYFKSICFTLLVPLIFIVLYRSLSVGISFAMFMTSMTTIYTFSVADKNDMERLYGILPISVTELVGGKYLHALLMGILSLFISCILQPWILHLLGITVILSEIMKSALAGLLLFVIYICFQLPGYYKFGPIKGRVFMYVPVIGIIFTMIIAGKAQFLAPVLRLMGKYWYLGPCIAIIFMALVIAASLYISVRILKAKD